MTPDDPTFFNESWRAQQDAQRVAYGVHVEKMTGLEVIQYVHWNILAAQAEIVEMLDELPWKSWSKNFGDMSSVNPAAVASEAADLMCFVTNVLLAVGVTAEQFQAAWASKIRKNVLRQTNGYDVTSSQWKCAGCGRALDDSHVTCTESECRASA